MIKNVRGDRKIKYNGVRVRLCTATPVIDNVN